MANKIQFRRGNKANLPSLDKGEPAVALDSSEFFIGGNSGNIQIPTKQITDQLAADLTTQSNQIGNPSDFLEEGISISDKVLKSFRKRGVDVKWFIYAGEQNAGLGINRATKYAYDNGLRKVIIPYTSSPFTISLETPVIVPSDCTLRGIGKGLHLKVMESTSRNFDAAVTGGDEKFVYGRGAVVIAGDPSTGKAYSRTSRGKNIKIQNVNIDGNESAINKTGLGTKANHHGIYVQFVDGLHIEKCRIENCLGSGIYSYVNSNQLIMKNECNHNGQLPFVPSSRNGISIACSDVDIMSNAVVRDNICNNNLNAGIMYGVMNNTLIIGNSLTGNLHKGIEGDNNNASTSLTVKNDIKITKNFIKDTLMTAIDVSSGNNGNISIEDNTIVNYGAYGILAQQNNDSDISIVKNKIRNGGIYILGDTTNGSTTITNVQNIYYWQQENAGVGCTIVGEGIPTGATVTAIDAVNNTLTISAAATATATGVSLGTITYNAMNVVGHVMDISGNRVRQHKMGHGLSVTRGYAIDIYKNYFEDIRQDGINITLTSKQDKEIDFINIDGNDFKTIGANPFTLYVSNASYKVRLLKITDNDILNPKAYSTFTKYLFQIRNNTTIDSMRVIGNAVVDTNATPKASQGLYFEATTSCARAIVTNNDFTNVLTAEIGNVARITSLKAKNNFNIADTA